MPNDKKIALMLGLLVLVSACAVVEPSPTPITPSPTASFTASLTSTPSLTPTFTLTPTPATPIAVALRMLQVRSGPGDEFSMLGLILENYPFSIYGISPDGQWALIGQPDQMYGWLALSSFVKLSGDLQNIPVVTVSPTPPTPPFAQPLSGMQAHSGPGTDYPVVSFLDPSYATVYPVYEASIDGGWYRIGLPDGQSGWIPASSLVEITGYQKFIPISIATNPPAPPAPIVKVLGAIYARNVPSTDGSWSAPLAAGLELELVARSADGAWYGVRLENQIVWIPVSTSVEAFGDISFLPTITPSPTPTYTPTPTVTASYTPIPTVDVNAIAATVESAVLATLSAQGIGSHP